MSTHPLFPRTGPFTWLLLQAASVVASILLAFGIDAWWANRKEAEEKNAFLAEFKAELLAARKGLDIERNYRIAARDSAKTILAAVAAGRYTDTEKTFDHRMADLLWVSSGAPAESGLYDGFMREGRVSAIKNEALRRELMFWRGWVDEMSANGTQDVWIFKDVVSPFLAKNSSLAQISNDSYKYGRPGDGELADPDAIVPTGPIAGHSYLLRNPEFAGIVLRKLWVDSDVMYDIGPFQDAIDRLVRLIDEELASTN